MTPKKIVTALLTLLLLLASGALAAADLTGTWKGDDGGTYYLRQVGEELYWYGENNPASPAWSNVFRGRIRGERIRGDWADVPKGTILNHGTLRLEVRPGDNELVAVEKSGGFGGSKWRREVPPLAAMPRPRPPMRPVPMAPGEDCVAFNPATARVGEVNGSWKIVDGNQWLFDFGSNRAEALQALRVIRHYRADRSCFVGRPDPSLTYLLAGDEAPAGGLPGEDCIPFDPATATVEEINGRWKIVDGGHWVFDFENKRNEAREALAIIRHHGFDHSCFVGRPHPSFSYLRR